MMIPTRCGDFRTSDTELSLLASCTVGGATVVGQAAGMCRISVFQAGDTQWNPVQLDLRFSITAPGY
jgi:hypothetical protein